ncbi:tRNA (adenosine(37)-N6)-dimethylallyltransferase MiaA [soil metagenome]
MHTYPADKPIYAIVGPTASGKTSLGVNLAIEIGGEIINCDSVQIYRGIQIATAKPTLEEMRGVPHHLIDYVDPEINYTAADWARDAARVIVDIEVRHRVPILVGGTGFYLRTLREPLFDSPPTDLVLRERLRTKHKSKGAVHLHKILDKIDPETAKRLNPNDYVRTIRAIEVFLQTGKRISFLQPDRAEPPPFADRIQLFVLDPPRDVLYEKINRRTEEHFSAGLVEEVTHLLATGVSDRTNALGAHAYRRVCEFLRGERDLASAIDKSKQDVRNYAKRQLTWFRREHGSVWLRGFGDEEHVMSELLRCVQPRGS